MRRSVLLCSAKFFQVALPVEVSLCAAVHQFEVDKSLCAADALLEKKAEVLVKLCRRDVREVEGAGGKVGQEALLEGDAFGGSLLGAFLESFRFDDGDFGVAGTVDLILAKQMNEAAGFGCGEVSEPDCLDRERTTSAACGQLLPIAKLAVRKIDPDAIYDVEMRMDYGHAKVKQMKGSDLSHLSVALQNDPYSMLIFCRRR